MPTEKKTRGPASPERKQAQLVRLQERFALASDGEVGRELAGRMLALAGGKAVSFLLSQVKREGHIGDAAIAALHAEPCTAETVARALGAKCDDACLARALSPRLSPRLIRDVSDLVPDVTDATALRYLVETLAQADSGRIPELHRLAADKGETRLGDAVLTGLAAAGDEAAFEALTLRLPESTSPRWRLMLTCQRLVESPSGIAKLRELLRSKRSPDRAYALRTIAAFDLAALARAVAERFIEEDDARCAAAAAEALHIPLQHLNREQLETVVESACDLSDLKTFARSHPERLAAAVATWVTRADRARQLCEAVSASPYLISAVVLAVLQVTGMLAPDLTAEPPEPQVIYAYSALLALQAATIQPLWRADRRLAMMIHRGLTGAVVEGMLGQLTPVTSQASAGDLLERLRDECIVGAQDAWRQEVVEQPQGETEHLRTHLARSVRRRVRLLQQLAAMPGGGTEVCDALRTSREREDEARQAAQSQVGPAIVANWQDRFDQRLLVLEPQVSIAGEFLKRRGRGLPEVTPPEAIVTVSAEQALKTDLCVLLSTSPLSSRVVRQLVDLLHSRSAVVRAAAEVTLARHPEVAGQLREYLKQATDPAVQARLLEISRCLGSPRLRAFAIESLGAEHELLAAAALKYLGQFGKTDDLASLPRVLRHEMSSVVRMALFQAHANLLSGNAESTIELATHFMGSASTFEAHLSFQLLLAQPREMAREALSRLAAGDDALTRVRAVALLSGLERGMDETDMAPPPVGVSSVAGDGVLGQSLMVTGDDPWQWGLPGLFDPPASLPLYWQLLCHDDELARSWDEWVLSGWSPLHLLPRLQGMMAGEDADAAAALALDIMGYGAGIYVDACADYHGLPVDDRVRERAGQVCIEVLGQCTPATVTSLRVPNPSRAAVFGEMLGTSVREEMRGHVFCLVFAELLKDSLAREFGGSQEAPSQDSKAFRSHVEREWDLLKPHEDWYYAFWVWPRLSLADMGRYCSDLNADPLRRQEIASYLAYQATTVPVLPQQARAAQKALALAFEPHLRRTARSIIDRHRRRGDVAAETDPHALQEGMYRKLVPVYRQAVRDFDVYWLSPHPIFALGSLRMAWEKHRPTESHASTPFPERHLSFARRLEKAVRHIAIEQFSGAKEQAPTVTYEQAELETLRSAEKVGQLVKEAKDEEERWLRQISRGKKTKPLANRALRSRPPAEPPILPQTVVIDGRPMECLDMRSASRKLGRSLQTLRKYGNDGDIRFVRDENGNRWLPVDEIHRAEIVLRRTGEWAKLLGVSKETARERLSEIPEGTAPCQMEEMLLAQKGDRRRRRGPS